MAERKIEKEFFITPEEQVWFKQTLPTTPMEPPIPFSFTTSKPTAREAEVEVHHRPAFISSGPPQHMIISHSNIFIKWKVNELAKR